MSGLWSVGGVALDYGSLDGYIRETHPQILFKECSHYCELVSSTNQMPRTLEVAIREAVGKRGVSAVAIPGDVALQPAGDAPLAAAADARCSRQL